MSKVAGCLAASLMMIPCALGAEISDQNKQYVSVVRAAAALDAFWQSSLGDPSPLDLPNRPFGMPQGDDIANAISSFEECNKACFNLNADTLIRVYENASNLRQILVNADRAQYAYTAMRGGSDPALVGAGPWDFKAHLGANASEQERRAAEVAGNINFAITAKSGFLIGDNAYLGLAATSRFSGAYALIESMTALSQQSSDLNAQLYKGPGSNALRRHIQTVEKFIKDPLEILNEPYGELDGDDILTIETAQEFDNYIQDFLFTKWLDENGWMNSPEPLYSPADHGGASEDGSSD